MPDKITADDVLRIARNVARRYARRCWWADVDDLTGEAARAVVESKARWDPQVGIPFDGYATRAAVLQVRDYLWRQSTPVSGGMHDPRKNIAGTHRAPVDEDMPQVAEHPAEALDEVAWRLAVRKRLRELAARTRDGDLAVEVAVRGRASGDVIRESGRDVYGAVHLLRRKVRTDAVLYELWKRGPS